MNIEQDMKLIEHLLDPFDQIARAGFLKYQDYPADLRVEHSARTAANIRYDHMLGEAERRLQGQAGVVALDVRGLKVWVINGNAVVRLKMMDEDGRSRNYPTKQATEFDKGDELPGLPPPAVRLTVGYLLDATQTEYQRTQIARPIGMSGIQWCAAIVPADVATGRRATFEDVSRQRRL